MNDYSSFIHHSQKLDQTSFNGCANKRTVTHPYRGLLLGNEKDKVLMQETAWMVPQRITLS